MPMRAAMRRRAQRGVTMLVVLVLLSVMLLGGLAMARLSEVGTLATGNAAYHETALQASEVGLNTGWVAVRNLADDAIAVAGWYATTPVAKDANGIPTVDWSLAPEVVVGQMSVRYVAERACSVAAVTQVLRECLVKTVAQDDSRDATREKLDPPSAKQYRITVRVTGPKGTQTFVQSLITRG